MKAENLHFQNDPTDLVLTIELLRFRNLYGNYFNTFKIDTSNRLKLTIKAGFYGRMDEKALNM